MIPQKVNPTVQMFHEMAAIAAYQEAYNTVQMAQRMFWLFLGGSDDDIAQIEALAAVNPLRKALFDLMCQCETPHLTDAQIQGLMH